MPSHEYIVVDIETTGLSRTRHKITEIAAVRVHGGKIVDRFQELVNPGVGIPRFITELTGIDDEMVADADPIEKVLPRFLRFAGDAIFVAHNASFDFGFLSHNASEYLNIELCNDRLCTRKLAYRLLPELERRRLADLCEHFEVVNDRAHRAMTDVLATASVFEKFLDMLSEIGVDELEDVMRFERLSRRKILLLQQ